MAEQAARHGFTITRPYGLAYIPEFGVYSYDVWISGDIHGHSGDTGVWIDGDTGALRKILPPSRQHLGNTVSYGFGGFTTAISATSCLTASWYSSWDWWSRCFRLPVSISGGETAWEESSLRRIAALPKVKDCQSRNMWSATRTLHRARTKRQEPCCVLLSVAASARRLSARCSKSPKERTRSCTQKTSTAYLR